jgi:thioesterase domain-containing protein
VNQPVYALQAIGTEGDDPVTDLSIEKMAEIYEREVTKTRPDGPVILAGYSFGVLVAFELLRRLRRHGRPVPLLISLDGFAPGFPRLLPMTERFRSHVDVFLHGNASRRRAYLQTRFVNIRRRVLDRLGRSGEPVADIPFADAELNQRLNDLWASLWRARSRYCPQGTEPCALLLIKAEIPDHWIGSKMDDPLYGWDSYVTGPISTVGIPGQHLRLFEPGNQRLIADAISHCVRPNDGNLA